jgi:hypothetical protein
MGLLANAQRRNRACEIPDRGVWGRIERYFALRVEQCSPTSQGSSPVMCWAEPVRRGAPSAMRIRIKANGDQAILNAPPPTDLSPLRILKHDMGGARCDVEHTPGARPPKICHRKDELHVSWIDLLASRDSTTQRNPHSLKACQRVANVAGIGQNASKAHSGSDGTVDLTDGDLRLCSTALKGSETLALPVCSASLVSTRH